MEQYTDRDLLNQIDAEIETALEMGFPETTLRVMLERFREKIAAQLRGEPWWEADRAD
jgi:hypothetical protein